MTPLQYIGGIMVAIPILVILYLIGFIVGEGSHKKAILSVLVLLFITGWILTGVILMAGL